MAGFISILGVLGIESVADGVGSAGDVLGIVSFVSDNIISHQQSQDSRVRVAVGLSNSHTGNMQGPFPAVGLWNHNHEQVGYTTHHPYIIPGGYQDVTIKQQLPGQQAPWLRLQATNDGICIAYVQHIWADGSVRGWLGDWGKECGQAWYNSNIEVGSGSKRHKPKCTWLDGNHSGGIPSATVQLDMDAFSAPGLKLKKAKHHRAKYCEWPKQDFRYKVAPPWNDQGWFTDPHADVRRKRSANDTMEEAHMQRKNRAQVIAEKFGGQVIVSSHVDHSAAELCDSEMSFGPDFVSVAEGLFCDMQEKQAWPLCSADVTVECYDVDLHRLLLESNAGTMAKRDVAHWNVTLWE